MLTHECLISRMYGLSHDLNQRHFSYPYTGVHVQIYSHNRPAVIKVQCLANGREAFIYTF
ncbi:hypothetical protein BDE27_0824 [Xenorhabdus ehlersii]|uniref:Uncharacterized protein n=1 Tax=Xenorhabdus ehlersii TaxID=290111 RepID=A0A2D0IM11_9GAMM|nr:hypothetical protein Xehl_03335 [Xenorhabdus ehlersii]RKE93116.1 hypothetical protein BDE27_0824 [Xenorhabdus ehlersii]